MNCIFCGSQAGTSIIDSRFCDKKGYVRRRHECLRLNCKKRFTTIEIPVTKLKEIKLNLNTFYG